MSGGSFDYLYNKEGTDLLDAISSLEAMVDQLNEWSLNSLAHKDAQRLLTELNEIAQKLYISRSLREVFHAVEWAVSHDTSKDQALQVIKAYEERG